MTFISKITALSRKIEEVAMKEPYFGEEIPLRWLQFERDVTNLPMDQHPYKTLEEVNCNHFR